jgi:hypothetical protein
MLFVGYNYYPGGASNDFDGRYYGKIDVEDRIKYLQGSSKYDWWEYYDIETEEWTYGTFNPRGVFS